MDELDQLLAEAPDTGPKREGEYSLDDIMDRMGLEKNNTTRQKASRLMQSYISEGKATMRKGQSNGRQANIYTITK